MTRRHADPVASLVRWRQFEQALASTCFEATASEARAATLARQQSADAERELQSARSRLLDIGLLDMARVEMVDHAHAEAAMIDEIKKTALESAELAQHDARQGYVLARARLRISTNRLMRNRLEHDRIEERHVFELMADAYAQNREKDHG